MKNIFDRLITVIVFLVSVTLASCIVGLMTRGNHAETPWWFLAGLGLLAAACITVFFFDYSTELLAAAASIGACMWGVKNDHD